MPIFRNHITLEIARGVKAFLRLDAGLIRGAVLDPERQLRQAQGRTEERDRQVEQMRRQLSKKDRQLAEGARRTAKSREQPDQVAPRMTQNPEHTRQQLAARNRKISELGGKPSGNGSGDPATVLYLELMKRCLTDAIYGDAEVQGRFPPTAHTMIGFDRLDNLQRCVETVLDDDVPGDLIETGAWRGGATILMQAILKARGAEDRRVWIADSFEGLPPPDAAKYPQDAGDTLHTFEEFKVSLEQVKDNFERYGLMEDRVRFLKGWFRDTLPGAPVEKLAVIRLDGDMYESTMDALVNLYPKLSVGGYLIVDDYGAFPACRQAVHDYREAHGIGEEIVPVDWSGVYWRRAE